MSFTKIKFGKLSATDAAEARARHEARMNSGCGCSASGQTDCGGGCQSGCGGCSEDYPYGYGTTATLENNIMNKLHLCGSEDGSTADVYLVSGVNSVYSGRYFVDAPYGMTYMINGVVYTNSMWYDFTPGTYYSMYECPGCGCGCDTHCGCPTDCGTACGYGCGCSDYCGNTCGYGCGYGYAVVYNNTNDYIHLCAQETDLTDTYLHGGETVQIKAGQYYVNSNGKGYYINDSFQPYPCNFVFQPGMNYTYRIDGCSGYCGCGCGNDGGCPSDCGCSYGCDTGCGCGCGYGMAMINYTGIHELHLCGCAAYGTQDMYIWSGKTGIRAGLYFIDTYDKARVNGGRNVAQTWYMFDNGNRYDVLITGCGFSGDCACGCSGDCSNYCGCGCC